MKHNADPAPDFIGFGAQKAGTGWLYDQLNHHPDFWMPPVKELRYFDKPGRKRMRSAEDFARDASSGRYARTVKNKPHRRPVEDRDIAFANELLALSAGPLDLAGYGRLFRHKGSQISGDITPAYSKIEEDLVAQIAASFPDCRFVFMARDPIERFWSQVRMLRFGKEWKRRLSEPLDVETVRFILSSPDYAERSHQSRIVKRWRHHAGDRVGVFLFDDLVADAADLRRRIVAFLGGDPDKPSGDLPPGYNRKAGQNRPTAMEPRVRAFLQAYFRDELIACAMLFGGAAERWPERHGVR